MCLIEAELFQVLQPYVPSKGAILPLGAAKTWKTRTGQNWGLELQKPPKPTQASDTFCEARSALCHSSAGSFVWIDNLKKLSPSQEAEHSHSPRSKTISHDRITESLERPLRSSSPAIKPTLPSHQQIMSLIYVFKYLQGW